MRSICYTHILPCPSDTPHRSRMNIFQELMQIIVLQRRPQDLSFDQTAAVFYFVLTVGLNYITSAQAGAFTQPLLISVIQGAAQAGLLFLFLQLANRAPRYIQTCTALFGITAILSALVWLLAQVAVLSIFVLMLMAWSFCLTILIMRDAFDASLLKAVFIAVALGAFSVMITMLVVPTYMQEAQALLSANNAS